MKTSILTRALWVAAGSLSMTVAMAADVKLTLTGAQEVPAVTTQATGNGTITIGMDNSVSGTITTSGIVGTAAHVHLAAPGKNGPPIITLTKKSDNEWSVPAGSKLTDEQAASFKAGDLYVNVHSAANKG
ncbi:MAG TPA: CHRD domain-containing protein, partial [Steroidobacteraceae bacterium]|nr:CHRD domain-containing protein [Steroidobacteraceae bacterium]